MKTEQLLRNRERERELKVLKKYQTRNQSEDAMNDYLHEQNPHLNGRLHLEKDRSGLLRAIDRIGATTAGSESRNMVVRAHSEDPFKRRKNGLKKDSS